MNYFNFGMDIYQKSVEVLCFGWKPTLRVLNLIESFDNVVGVADHIADVLYAIVQLLNLQVSQVCLRKNTK
jgi:hypothetical protein